MDISFLTGLISETFHLSSIKILLGVPQKKFRVKFFSICDGLVLSPIYMQIEPNFTIFS